MEFKMVSRLTVAAKKNILILVILLNSVMHLILAYEIPKPNFKMNQSRHGFRVSIPDEPGIKFFSFNGALNRRIRNNEPGDITGLVHSKKNQEWIYENNDIMLSRTDVLYYWIYVQYKSTGLNLLNQNIRVSEFENYNDGNAGDKSDTNDYDYDIDIKVGCALSKTTANGKRVCKGELLFEENFDSFNQTRWQHDIYIPNDLNDADFVMFQNRSENLYTKDGNLFILPRLFEEFDGCGINSIRSGLLNLGSQCTATNFDKECRRQAENFRILPPIVSSKIRTKNSFAFRYGKIEVRAKLPKGDWLFPQILLEPLENFYGHTGFSSGQLRIAHIVGNEILYNSLNEQINGNRLLGGIIVSNDESNRNTWLKSTFRDHHFGDDFHEYALIWTDEFIKLTVDDNTYGIIDGGFSSNVFLKNLKSAKKWKLGGSMAPFDREFYISLGVSAGGIGDFPDDCRNGIKGEKKPWLNRDPKGEFNFWKKRSDWLSTWKCDKSRMIVDYVRVWAL